MNPTHKKKAAKALSPKLAKAYEQRLLKASGSLDERALTRIFETCHGSEALVDGCDILSDVARKGSSACVRALMPHSSSAKCSRSLASAAASGSEECLALLLGCPAIDQGAFWARDVSAAISSAIRSNHAHCVEFLAPLLGSADLSPHMEDPLLLAVIIQQKPCFDAILPFCHAGALSSVLASMKGHLDGVFIDLRRPFAHAIVCRLSLLQEHAAIAASSAEGCESASRGMRL